MISFGYSEVSWAGGLILRSPEIHCDVMYFTDKHLDPIYIWNIINSIHLIRTYINTTVSLFPTCLLIHHSVIFIRSCQSLSILISSGATVSSRSGPSLQVRVRVATELLTDWPSGLSIHLKPSIRAWFDGHLPTRVDWVGCQQVTQRLHL